MADLIDAQHKVETSIGVQRSVDGLWALLVKHKTGIIDHGELVRFVSCLAKTLLAGCSNDQATATARQALEATQSMDKQAFQTFMINLAHVYCESFDPLEYEAFFVGLKIRISRAAVVLPDLKEPVELVARINKVAIDEDDDKLESFWKLQARSGISNTWTPEAIKPFKGGAKAAQLMVFEVASTTAAEHLQQSGSSSSLSFPVISQSLTDLDNVTAMPSHIGSKDPKEAHTFWSPQVAAQADTKLPLIDAILARYKEHFGSSTSKAVFASAYAHQGLESGFPPPQPPTQPMEHSSVIAGGIGSRSPHIAIVGLPRSGKSSVARNLCKRTGFQYLTPAEVAGQNLSLFTERTGGFVLDISETLALDESSTAPTTVVHLKLHSQDAQSRLTSMKIHRASDNVFTGAEVRALQAQEAEAEAAAAAAAEARLLRKKAREARAAARAAALAAGEEPAEEEDEEEEEEEEELQETQGNTEEEAEGEGEGTEKPIKIHSSDLEPLYTSDEVEQMMSSHANAIQQVLSSASQVITVDASQNLDVMLEQTFNHLSDALGGLPDNNFVRAYCTPRALLYKPPAVASDEEEGEVEAEPPLETPEEEQELRLQLLYNVAVEYKKEDENPGEETEEKDEDTPEVEPEKSPELASFRHLSAWGLICPVTLEEGRARYAVLWRGHVYFCSQPSALETFMENPSQFALRTPVSAGRVLVVAASAELAHKAAESLAKSNTWTDMSMAAGAWYDLKPPEQDTEAIQDPPPSEEDGLAQAEGVESKPPPVHPLSAILSDNRWTLALGAEVTTPEQAFGVFQSAERMPRVVIYAKFEDPPSSEQEEVGLTPEQDSAVQDGSAETTQGEELTESKPPLDLMAEPWAALAQERGVTFISTSIPFTESREDLIVPFNEPLSQIAPQLDNLFAAKAIEEGAYKKLLGWSQNYCPVVFMNESRLVPGKPEFTAFHDKAFYTFSSAESMAKFKEQPSTYQRPLDLQRPHPVVLLLGAEGTGKTECAQYLSSSFGLQHITRHDIETHVVSRQVVRRMLKESIHLVENSIAEAKAKAARELALAVAESKKSEIEMDHVEGEEKANEEEESEAKDQEEGEVQEESPEDPEAAAARAEAEAESERLQDVENRQSFVANLLQQGGCILDDVVQNLEIVQSLASLTLVPTVVLRLVAEQELAVQRTMNATFRWTPPQPKTKGRVVEGIEGEEGTSEEGQPEEEDAGDEEEEPVNLEELRENARAEWEEAVRNRFAQSEQAGAEILQFLREAGVRCYDSIDMNGRMGLMPALRSIRSKVLPFSQKAPRDLDAPQACLVSLGMANMLMKEGLVLGAPIGSHCPVDLTDHGRICRCHSSASEVGIVLFRSFLYSPSSDKNVKRFLSSPGPFAENAHKQNPEPRKLLRCAVLGGGGDYKRRGSFVGELARMFGLVSVTLADSIEYVKSHSTDPDSGSLGWLGEQLQNKPSDTETLALCVAARCQAYDAAVQGFVLEDYPRTVDDADWLRMQGLLPDYVMFCGARQGPRLADLVDLERWIHNWSSIARIYLNSNHTVWSNVDEASATIVQKSISSLGTASRTEDSGSSSRSRVVKLNGVAAMGVQDLLDRSPALGYCVVSYVDSDGQRVVQGSPSELVYCDQGYFVFSNPSASEKFIENPETYLSSVEACQAAVKELPLSAAALLAHGDRIGYLEQTVAPILRDGLEQCGILRLKHPSLSLEDSCAKFMALYLRAKNDNVTSTARARREQMLHQYLTECQLFDRISKHAAGGSGLRAVRSCRDQIVDERSVLIDKFEDLLHQPPSILLARFTSQ